MKRRSSGALLTGLKNLLNDKDISQSKSDPKKNSADGMTLFISLVAIAISLFTLYFQFFYEKNELRINFVSASFENDSTLISQMVYHNKGNTYATVLGNKIVFYQDSNTIENKSITFSKQNGEQSFETAFEPLVLSPGQQVYKEIDQPFNFKKIIPKHIPINFKEKIRMALAISYINSENGLYTTNYIPIGWLRLDSNLRVQGFNVDYKTELLTSDRYYSGVYRNRY
jgi:hypothetical protein